MRKSAVGDFYVGRSGNGRKFPTDDGATRHVVMPVGKPGVGEDAGRIVLDDLAVAFELGHAVDYNCSLLCSVAVASAEACVHLPEFCGALGRPEPLHELGAVSEGLEDTLGGCGNFNLADYGVLIGRDDGGRHGLPFRLLRPSARSKPGRTNASAPTRAIARGAGRRSGAVPCRGRRISTPRCDDCRRAWSGPCAACGLRRGWPGWWRQCNRR